MKGLLLCFLWSLTSALFAQNDTTKLKAFGVDFFKNFYYILPNQQYSHPRLIEGYGLFRLNKPNRFLNLGVGYVGLQAHVENRLLQSITGGFVRVVKEIHRPVRSKTSFFGGYGGTVSLNKVNSQLYIKGDYFQDYLSKMLTMNGMGISAEGFMGYAWLLSRHIEVRFVGKGSLGYIDVGTPNVFYLSGAGLRPWKKPVTVTGSFSIQLGYQF